MGSATLDVSESSAERDESESELEHSDRCGCRGCDPDFYFDPAERARDR